MAEDREGEWLAAWVDTWGDRLVQFANTYTHDPQWAQDVAQETLLRLYQTHRQFPRKPISPGWLFTVARNVIRDAHRKRIPVPREPDGVATTPGPPLEDVEKRLAVQAILDRMPAQDQQCLWLFYYADWSIQQIADALQTNTSTVRTRLYRARLKFATLWEEDHEQSD